MVMPMYPSGKMQTFGGATYRSKAFDVQIGKLVRTDKERPLCIGHEILKPLELFRIKRSLSGSGIICRAIVGTFERIEKDQVRRSKIDHRYATPGNRGLACALRPFLEECRAAVVIAHDEMQRYACIVKPVKNALGLGIVDSKAIRTGNVAETNHRLGPGRKPQNLIYRLLESPVLVEHPLPAAIDMQIGQKNKNIARFRIMFAAEQGVHDPDTGNASNKRSAVKFHGFPHTTIFASPASRKAPVHNACRIHAAIAH
jgi:hypothetical protein